jgi:hypothetical protein
MMMMPFYLFLQKHKIGEWLTLISPILFYFVLTETKNRRMCHRMADSHRFPDPSLPGSDNDSIEHRSNDSSYQSARPSKQPLMGGLYLI